MAEVKARMGLDVSPFNQGLDRATAKINAFASGKLSSVKGALAGAFSFGAIAAAGKEVVNFASQITDTSERLQISAKTLQEQSFGAKQVGSSIESLTGAYTKLSLSVDAALDGDEMLRKHFADLGITVKDLKSMTMEQIFLKVADGYSTATDKGIAMADVLKVIGKGNADLLPLLLGGSKGIEEFANRARELNLVLDDETRGSLDRLGDKMDETALRAKVAFAPVVNFFGTEFLNRVDDVTKGFETMKKVIGGQAFKKDDFLKTLRLAASFSGTGSLLKDVSMMTGIGHPTAPQAQQKPKASPPNRQISLSNEQKAAAKEAEKEAQAKAYRIETLSDQVSKQAEEQARAQLPIEEQINQLIAEREDLLSQGTQAKDGEEYLKIQKDALDVEKEISSLKKEQTKENDQKAKVEADKVKQFLEFQDRIDEVKTTKGISVSAPITDSLARIGGFVGGSGDNQMRMMERQMKVQEDIKNIISDIRKKIDPYGSGEADDIVSALNTN